MATLNELQGQLKGTESALSQYDANLPSEIESQIQKAHTPALQQSLGDTKNMMRDYLQRYFDVTTMGPGTTGTTAKDLSPTQKLGVMGRELGTMSGQLQASSKLSDYLGGQMNDMYGKALQAAQMGQQNLADKYARQMQQLQMAWQESEAEKDRALSRELAARSGSGGGQINLGDYLDQPDQTGGTDQYSQADIIHQVKNIANSIAQQRGKVKAYNYQGQPLGGINDVFRFLTQRSQAAGVNLNPEWVWAQLGNAPTSTAGKALL